MAKKEYPLPPGHPKVKYSHPRRAKDIELPVPLGGRIDPKLADKQTVYGVLKQGWRTLRQLAAEGRAKKKK